uniref:MADS-box domain-containing protein n=1 Tax=Brassica oleracea TaxID=3712 RepID=A0A3P6DTW6_BRAOL|nr:unnamed protein product [Brassica oleracea]
MFLTMKKGSKAQVSIYLFFFEQVNMFHQILCDIDIVLLMYSPSGYPSLYTGKHSIGEVIAKKLGNLELCSLEENFMKLDHDVNISGFLDRRLSHITSVVLSKKVRILQTHLSEIDTRLSYWTEVERIDSIDDLQLLENSVRQSLYQIRTHKMTSEIDVDFGMDMEQQLENFSWVHTDESMNVPLKQEDPNMQFYHTYRDITCSASSSLESYSGIFGSPADYYVSQILEASYKPHELSSTKAQVQTSSQTPEKTRLTQEEKGKAKMYEEDLPCAVLQSKCDSSDSSDQRSQRVSLSQKKLEDKTLLKTGTDRAFCLKLSNAFSALDCEADTG